MKEELEITLRGAEFKRLQDRIYENVRERYSLKRIEVEVLYALSRDKACNTPTEISKRFKLNRGHVSQAIDVLSKRELIVSSPDKEDRRSTHYFPSEKAEEIIRAIEETHNEVFNNVVKDVSQDEIEMYLRVSRKIIANIRKAVDEL